MMQQSQTSQSQLGFDAYPYAQAMPYSPYHQQQLQAQQALFDGGGHMQNGLALLGLLSSTAQAGGAGGLALGNGAGAGAVTAFFDFFERTSARLDESLLETRREAARLDAQIRAVNAQMLQILHSRDESLERCAFVAFAYCTAKLQRHIRP